METEKRKPMRLHGYDYSQRGCYFITICVKDRKRILSTIECTGDKHVGVAAPCDPNIKPQFSDVPQIHLTPIGEIVEKYIKNINGVDVYAIMPDHIHLIIRKDVVMEWADLNKSQNFGSENFGSQRAATPTRMPPTRNTSTRKTSIPQDIKALKSVITKEIGHSIWQRGYYDHIIRNDEDYIEKYEYIINNPIKWIVMNGEEGIIYDKQRKSKFKSTGE